MNNTKNIVFLIHGVMTKQENNWVDRFAEKIKNDSLFNNWIVEKGEWGNLFFLFSIIPFIRYFKIKQTQIKLRVIQKKYPNATIHVIAHSYGSMLIHEAVKYSDIDTKESRINLGTVILIGGIISEFEKFKDTLQEGQIKCIYNFCSYKDRVIKWQPLFGKCGYWGFVKDKKRKHILNPYENLLIKNFRFNVRHSEYFSEEIPDFYILWKQLLLRENKRNE